MSLDLLDCRFKIHPVTLAILKGKAKAEGKDVADILRVLADREAEKFRVCLIEAQRVLAQQGLLGELQGVGPATDKFAASDDGAVNLDAVLE
jgi:hypothetical protein